MPLLAVQQEGVAAATWPVQPGLAAVTQKDPTKEEGPWLGSHTVVVGIHLGLHTLGAPHTLAVHHTLEVDSLAWHRTEEGIHMVKARHSLGGAGHKASRACLDVSCWVRSSSLR